MSEIAKREEFFRHIARNDKGEIQPVEAELEDGTLVKIVPLELKDIIALQNSGTAIVDESSKNEPTAKLLSKHLAEPSFTTEELLSEEFLPLKFAQLTIALLECSGYSTKKKRRG